MRDPLEQLTASLSRLPGIGRKSAQRIAFHLLRDQGLIDELTGSMNEARRLLHECPECFCYTTEEVCSVCRDPSRDHSLLCVVEEPADALALEQAGSYRGIYHVLGGALSPICGVGPQSLRMDELLKRVGTGIQEIIIATNPTTEGEATAVYIARALKDRPVRVTRIARGLPVGADIELADVETISRALEGRNEI